MAPTAAASTEAIHQRPVELLRDLIRFDTTNPPGNERECISYIEALVKAAGCETTLRARNPERPNLIARMRGRGNAPPLLLYGHVDVVTTENQRWRYPPFEAEIVDGYVWGRGALDMKGGVAMMLSAFLRASAEETELPGDVIFCALSDEEGFGSYGAAYLVENHAELFEGVRYAIGEFGGFTMHIGSRRFYPIQVAEKQICTVRVKVRGPGGHGAMPVRRGAMARLAQVLSRLDRTSLPVHVTPVVRQMCRAIGEASPFPTRIILRQLLNPLMTDRLLRLLGDRGRMFGPLLHNTVSPTIVSASDKVNVIPSEASVVLDGRLLPGREPADLIRELEAVLDDDVEIDLIRHDSAPADVDMALFDLLAGAIRTLDREAVPIPLLMAGVTDGRFFSRIGIQTYGFVPMNLPPDFDFWSTVHAADERVPVAAIEFGSEAIYRALRAFAGDNG